MKKALSLILALLICLSLCACANDQVILPPDYTFPQTSTSDTTTDPSENAELEQETSNNAYNVLYGKSLICLGDSITYGSGLEDTSKVWGNLIAQRNEMDFTNAGISGSTMGESVDGEDRNACYKNGRYLAVEGHDYALIWFGWNDHAFCELGTYDGTDETTTLVAYRLTLEYILQNYPETKVGVIIPYLWERNVDPQGHTDMEMLNGIKEVCEQYGVPYLDLPQSNFLPSWGSDCPHTSEVRPIWEKRQEVFTSDGLHPNEKGHEYLSTMIEDFLRSL